MTNNIIEFLSRVDVISSIVGGVLITILTFGKVGWDVFKKKKRTLRDSSQHNMQITDDSSDNGKDEALESLEVISETYVAIIKNLRQEVDRLKSDVEDLLILRQQHEQCQREITVLRSENVALEATNLAQEEKIELLASKIKRLELKVSKRRNRKDDK